MLTFIAVGIKLAIGVREACLVLIAIQGSHPKQTPAALGPRHRGRVADAAVRQPAVVALVKAVPPGHVEVPHGSQDTSSLLTQLPSFLEGELLGGCDVDHLICRRKQKEKVTKAE